MPQTPTGTANERRYHEAPIMGLEDSAPIYSATYTPKAEHARTWDGLVSSLVLTEFALAATTCMDSLTFPALGYFKHSFLPSAILQPPSALEGQKLRRGYSKRRGQASKGICLIYTSDILILVNKKG